MVTGIAVSVCGDTLFHLHDELTKFSYGPYRLQDGDELFKDAYIETKESGVFRVQYFSGQGPQYEGPFPGTNRSPVTIAGKNFVLIIDANTPGAGSGTPAKQDPVPRAGRLALFEGAWFTNRQAEAIEQVYAVIDGALKADSFEKALILLDEALKQYSDAPNIHYLQIMRDEYCLELEQAKNGFMRVGSKWIKEDDVKKLILEAACGEEEQK